MGNTGYYLVGRLLTTKVYKIEFLWNALLTTMNPGKGLEIKDIGGQRFLLKFNHIVDKNRAMDGCPWAFDKNVMILNTVDSDENPSTVDLNWCAFYVYVHGLPLGKMTKQIAQLIGGKMG
ncbi:hypothetical protein Salat_0203600 [Sesamum alatum]|uniref:DUF4283 domain-containing protein n=1 Tax=Sesamum alatum TaxID=300844 RepID=A0AAE1YZP6_9LAMI|nr:hypothetical protein Salat_0203600 [Sesamum alatum]